jgi:hypothetical protein
MSYRKDGDKITIELTEQDYKLLMFGLGHAANHIRDQGIEAIFYTLVALTNRVNEGNPEFTPYEVPEKYQ